MQLVPAHVDADHMGRAVLQQAVGESARRAADVEAARPGDVDAEDAQCRLELLAAARDVARRRHELDAGRCGDRGPGLRHDRPLDDHAAGHDQGLRAAARLGDPPLAP